MTTSTRPALDLTRPVATLKAILTHPGYRNLMRYGLLLGEVCLCSIIIAKVPFTNIDWRAYMEQVETFLRGERNYTKIRGDTGPLVYPAGFLWIFSAFYYFTEQGQNIQKAQTIFAVIYLATLAITFRLYKYSLKIPPYAYILLTLSKRLHSLYILRCFNDCVASLLLYASILLLCKRRFAVSSVLYSLALSVKMNILLVAPAFGLLLLLNTGLLQTARYGILIVALQALLGGPFLIEDWRAYIGRAFEFSRVFIRYWSVNWQFLPEKVFLSKTLAKVLLAGHAITLMVAVLRWCQPSGGLSATLQRAVRYPARPAAFGKLPSPSYMITVLFSCNLVGILFARSLHYQFYAWEAHQLVFLLWQTRLPLPAKLAILGGIEVGYETFPANALSSSALVVSHACLVVAVLLQVDWRNL